MNVTQYRFQSPYSSQFQVGIPDASSQKSDTTQEGSSELVKSTNKSLEGAEKFQTTQEKEVKVAVESEHNLDTYA